MSSTKSEQDTAELEILSVDLIPSEEELEMDADTYSLDEESPRERSAELLRSDLRSKDERISSLQYDIAQLQSRWNGLEKEIEAREELTSTLQDDLRAARQQLRERERYIRRLEDERDSEKVAVADALDEKGGIDVGLDAVDERLKGLSRQASEDAERIRQLEQDLEQARSRDSKKSGRWMFRGDLPKKYAERGKEISALKRREASLERELREANSDRGRVKAMLKVAQGENADLKARLKEARIRIKDYTANERPASAETIARQEGQIADQKNHLAELEIRLQQSQEYGDELRRKLADTRSDDVDLADRTAELEQSLADTRRCNADLETALDEAMRKVEDLEQRARRTAAEHEAEQKTLRFELGEAQETIARQESVNEELAAEIIEKTTVRESLQQSLEEKVRGLEATLETLNSRLRQADARLAEAKEQMANKDKSIAALLSELASKSESIESIDGIEEAIKDLNGRISNRFDDQARAKQGRPERALTGVLEGRELRFPLDKDRLTIGRSAKNDIQLHAQFVSRHHAILLFEDGKTRIVDWGSKNGIYVNSERVGERELADGDRLTIGNAEFHFEERSGAKDID